MFQASTTLDAEAEGGIGEFVFQRGFDCQVQDAPVVSHQYSVMFCARWTRTISSRMTRGHRPQPGQWSFCPARGRTHRRHSSMKSGPSAIEARHGESIGVEIHTTGLTA
jgi:hypothetical protein